MSAPALRVNGLADDDARVDLVTVADGRAAAKVLGACAFAAFEAGEAPGADDFDLVQAERNARRIVAAWNLTRAVPLEVLEQWDTAGKVLGDTGKTGQA